SVAHRTTRLRVADRPGAALAAACPVPSCPWRLWPGAAARVCPSRPCTAPFLLDFARSFCVHATIRPTSNNDSSELTTADPAGDNSYNRSRTYPSTSDWETQWVTFSRFLPRFLASNLENVHLGGQPIRSHVREERFQSLRIRP